MSELPEQGSADQTAVAWNVRESILDSGFAAAQALGKWGEALGLSQDMLVSQQVRGASAHVLASTRFRQFGPLLRQQLISEARAILVDCRAVFEEHQDVPRLTTTLSALATVEDSGAHHLLAASFETTALRYAYTGNDPGQCALLHNNLSVYLDRAQITPRAALAHRLAAAVIRLQLQDARLHTTTKNLALGVVACAPQRPHYPEGFDELCRIVEETEGVRFRELFDELPRHAADGDQALQAVIRMADDLAAHTKEK